MAGFEVATEEQYTTLLETVVGLPSKLTGRWFFPRPFEVSKAGIVDGIEFQQDQRIRFFSGNRDTNSRLSIRRYTLPRPSTIRFHGQGNVVEDFLFELSGNSLHLEPFGRPNARLRAIRMGPGPSDDQMRLGETSLNGRWTSPLQQCFCPEGPTLISVLLESGKASFDVYHPTLDQIERDVFDLSGMKPDRFEATYRLLEPDYIEFSEFAGDQKQQLWRAQVFPSFLALQSQTDIEYSFIRR